MCMLIAILERTPGLLPHWVWYDCGTAIRCQDNTFRPHVGQRVACPTHDREEFYQNNYRYDRLGRVEDVAKDQ